MSFHRIKAIVRERQRAKEIREKKLRLFVWYNVSISQQSTDKVSITTFARDLKHALTLIERTYGVYARNRVAEMKPSLITARPALLCMPSMFLFEEEDDEQTMTAPQMPAVAAVTPAS